MTTAVSQATPGGSFPRPSERKAMDNRPVLRIRDARDDEREAIRALTLAAYAEYAPLLPPTFWEGYRRQLLATLDDAGRVERIVAERDGRIIGGVMLYAADASAYGAASVRAAWPEVRLLAVAPEARGQGVGAALMEACRQRARQAGASALGLHTMDFMHAAVRLYERMGFERVPELDFRPVESVLVKGYRLSLDDGPGD
jgi:GNAT superfamily N-acetyltransferase